MHTQNVAHAPAQSQTVDVDMSQATGLGIFPCYSRYLWAIVHVDQSQVVYPSERGSAQCTALEKNRSRGCRALRSPFLPCAWLRSLQPAPSLPKKLFTWTSLRSPPNPSIPANTSNHQGRALWAKARPALFPCAKAVSARIHRPTPPGFATAESAAYDGPPSNDNHRRPSCGQPHFLPLSLSQPLRPAPNPRQNLLPSKNLLRLNQPRPANTNDLTGRVGSFRPPRKARLSLRNPYLKVGLC